MTVSFTFTETCKGEIAMSHKKVSRIRTKLMNTKGSKQNPKDTIPQYRFNIGVRRSGYIYLNISIDRSEHDNFVQIQLTDDKALELIQGLVNAVVPLKSETKQKSNKPIKPKKNIPKS